MCRIFLLWFMIINLIGLYCGYTIDPVKLELLDNKFRVSLPDYPNIKWVAFNVNINKEFREYEEGQLSGVVGRPLNQIWSFEFNRILKDSDIVYIWVTVQHDRLVYRDRKAPISVQSLKGGNPNSYVKTSPTITTTESPNENKICYPTITKLQTPRHLCKDDIIFEDKFDTFSEEHWTNEVRLPQANDDYEFVLYNGTVGIESGILKIEATLDGRNIKDKIDLGERMKKLNAAAQK